MRYKKVKKGLMVYLGPSVGVLLEGGEDLLGHLLLVAGAGVHGVDHLVQQADVQLLVEVQQLVDRLLGQRSRHPGALGGHWAEVKLGAGSRVAGYGVFSAELSESWAARWNGVVGLVGHNRYKLDYARLRQFTTDSGLSKTMGFKAKFRNLGQLMK